jgi:hypothetical protein
MKTDEIEMWLRTTAMDVYLHATTSHRSQYGALVGSRLA